MGLHFLTEQSTQNNMEARENTIRLAAMAAAAIQRSSRAIVSPEYAIAQVRAAFSADVNGATVTDQEMLAALELAERNGLNPLTGGVRLGPDFDKTKTGLVPFVTIDGWAAIINNHQDTDGLTFAYSSERVPCNERMAHEWIECSIYRKGRSVPTTVREYLSDCVVHTSAAWTAQPNRMLRQKAMEQCARIALGLSCGMSLDGGLPAAEPTGAATVQMVQIDTGAAVQTVSTESVASAPDQTTGRPRRAAARKTPPPAPPVEGVVLEAQESLLPEVAQAPAPTLEPKSDSTPTASPAAVKRLALKVNSTFDEAGRTELLSLAGVQGGIRDGMTEGDVARVNAVFDDLLSGGA